MEIFWDFSYYSILFVSNSFDASLTPYDYVGQGVRRLQQGFSIINFAFVLKISLFKLFGRFFIGSSVSIRLHAPPQFIDFFIYIMDSAMLEKT